MHFILSLRLNSSFITSRPEPSPSFLISITNSGADVNLQITHKAFPSSERLSSVSGGQKFTPLFLSHVFLVDEGREDPNKRIFIDPPAKRQLNGVSLVFW